MKQMTSYLLKIPSSHAIPTCGKDQLVQIKYLIIDMEKVDFIKSSLLSRLKCIADQATLLGKQVQFIYPTNEECKTYAGRMGLFDGYGTGYHYPHTKHESDKFFPLLKIHNDRNDALLEMTIKVFEQSNASTGYVRSLAEVFSELADNIYFHSGEKINSGWGYVHAQAFPKKGTITISVADNGIGFYESYKRTQTLKGRDEGQIIKDSIKEMESCLNLPNKPAHRGIGLHEAVNFIEHYGGSLSIQTGNHYLSVTKNNEVFEKMSYTVSGSLIEMSIPIL